MNAIAKPSIQSLFIEMQFDGQSLSTGTAFVVNTPTKGPHLVTNRHNVTGRNQETGKPLSKTGGVPNNLVIFHNKLGNIGHWVMRQEPLYKHDESPRWIEHPTLEHQADFVALPLTNLHDVELYPYDHHKRHWVSIWRHCRRFLWSVGNRFFSFRTSGQL
jgi:hypothetical protein